MALYSTKSGKKVQQNKFKQLTLIDLLVFSANFSNNISAVLWHEEKFKINFLNKKTLRMKTYL